ncbi:four-carbon acid sugar kinase family protein [Chenggangzhangella methanolivorans]|uniref:Four-carbon acid sugar kinase family protein n=1 Tax=Chenggangzhangella methanolivorans TaxID=1437009 RepID=A0A9E6R6D9_9HYPH|nr:four-carbon acid sugar kinase family protein [Chenggangzhangella methanolivorans]QZN98644.1 four-carbon acid sugar kinase family protein [Chenggangzhangella methanolivorans]
MSGRWLILADDLTGAADCAIAFGRRGLAAAVSWGVATDDRGSRPPVFSYDADSRGMTGEAAGRRHVRALSEHLERDRVLFKKIDSTLRGQPAAETAATIAHLRSHGRSGFGVFAPAFPATGRTTVDGRILVSGGALEDTETWKRDHTYDSADLTEALASAEVAAEKVLLPVVRGEEAALVAALESIAAKGDVVAVCDAESDADLAAVAKASLALSTQPFFIGSAGLAHALAAVAPLEPTPSPRLAPTANGTLIVVGSLAASSRSGARKLVESGAVSYVPASPEVLLAGDRDGRADLGRDVARRLSAGEDVLVEILMGESVDMSIGASLAAGLASALEAVPPAVGAFAATGGETAAALLSRFGVTGIRLADEIEPGVSLGLTLGELSVPIATKAGAFGDEMSITRIAERLKAVRTEGSFA